MELAPADTGRHITPFSLTCRHMSKRTPLVDSHKLPARAQLLLAGPSMPQSELDFSGPGLWCPTWGVRPQLIQAVGTESPGWDLGPLARTLVGEFSLAGCQLGLCSIGWDGGPRQGISLLVWEKMRHIAQF